MTSTLRDVAEAVLTRARIQGYVISREIREELAEAGQPPDRWKEVVHEAGVNLTLRNGRYYYVSRIRARLLENHRHLQGVKRAAQGLITKYKAIAVERERRNFRRIHCILPVKLLTADNRELHMLSQDISLTGIRLVGVHDLKGQTARLFMPSIDRGVGEWCFSVQFLWSASIGDQLIENGGIFLEVEDEPHPANGN